MLRSLATIFGDSLGGDLGWGAIVAFVAAWVIAQGWKFVVGMYLGKGQPMMQNFRTAVGYLTRSGGMPSGHSAWMTAATVYLGCYYGFTSGIFALAVASTGIVLYDAIHVRYAVGEQGKALNKLLKKAGEPTLPVVEGHTIPQMIVGVMIGVIVGLGVYFLIAG